MATPDILDKNAVQAQRDRTRGKVLEPGQEGYDDARTVWNAMIDRKPAVIIQCAGVADVMAAVTFARENGLPISVKCGGHHVSGSAVCEDGLVIDLSPMDGIRVDPESQSVRVQAGATWGDIDHETQRFGLAVPGGQDPNIGVSGLTLGGGIGWLSRKYGLTSDNLVAADVVTTDGKLVHASEEKNPDLFWALRGGGGNFGIVTSFKFNLYRVGPEILAGSLIYPLEVAANVFDKYTAFMEHAPREVRLLLGIMELPAASYYPKEVHNSRVVLLIVFYGGDPEKGQRVLAPLRELGDPIWDSIQRRSYVSFQQAGKSSKIKRTYLKSLFLKSLPDHAVETIIQRGSEVPSEDAKVFVAPHDGAETDPPSDATAYPHRVSSHRILIETRWDDPENDDENINWTKSFRDTIQPYSTERFPINFVTDDVDKERIKASYGGNFERLSKIKAKWDPESFLSID